MEAGREEAKKIIEEGFVHEKERRRCVFGFEPAFQGSTGAGGAVDGKHFAITDDAGMVSVTLKKQLEAHGAVRR